MTSFAADYPDAEVVPSPNFGERQGVSGPDCIILHYTGMESGQGAQDWLCAVESQVSSHYLVHEDGRIVQMVREADRAWHAGRSFWKGVTDINSVSVGIEIVNPGHILGYADFPDLQVDAVIRLCRDISTRHAIAPERVLAHSDVAPGRKIDPGEKFPWRRLAAEGVGLIAAPTPISGGRFIAAGDRGEPVEALQSMLSLYGYGVKISGLFDSQTETVVSAFQRHFRPERVDGVADRSTIETLHALLSKLLGSEGK